jgi:hypothetical protein
MIEKRKSAFNAKGEIKLDLSSLENPFAHLSEAERLQLVTDIAKQHGDDYNAKLRRIEEIIRSANPRDVLAHYAFYDLLLLEQLDSKRETARERLQQHNVELLQALYLTLPIAKISPKPLRPHVFAELSDCLQSLAPAFSLRRLASKPPNPSVLPIELIRMHTQTIRNRGYPDQIFKFLKEVFRPLDADMAKVSGIKPSLLVAMVLKLIRKMEDAGNAKFKLFKPVGAAKSVEEAVRNYYKLLPTDQDVQRMLDWCKERKLDLYQTKAVLLSHHDLELWRIYEFSLKDFTAAYPEPISEDLVRTLLAVWSLKPGDLCSHDKEHFFLSNPIWNKPLIQIGEDRFFWPLLQMFMSFGLEMIEALVDLHPELKERYESEIRPKYLEDEAERVLRVAFPQATILRGSLWHDSATGKDFENDILMLLDSFLIVTECKSGAIPPSARRGGQRLEVAVRNLITEPAEQCARFGEHLLKNRGLHTFQTKRGVVNHCNTTKVRHLIRLSLTLDFFGPLTCMSRLLEKGGVVQAQISPAVTMPIVALETAFDVLEGVHQKLHYLSRRVEWESHVDYMADEYDLLAFYLATGFNVGAFEFEKGQQLMIYGLSEQLDAYFRAKILGRPVSKPGLKLTQWWRDILAQAEKRAFDGWADVGMFLLSANHSDQWNFEKASKKLKKKVRANWQKKGHENFLIGATGPAQRRTAITAYAFKEHVTREKRDSDIQSVFGKVVSETGCKDVLIIGIDADERRYPYQFLAIAMDIEPEADKSKLVEK